MLNTTENYTVPCSKGSPDLWFSNRKADVEKCKAVCNTCLLKMECLRSTLEYEQQSGTAMTGTHGGLSVAERKKIKSMRRIA